MHSASRTGYERREALRRGLVAGAALLTASTTPGLLRVGRAFADSEDAAIIESAISVERTLAAAYVEASESGLLDRSMADVARLFRDQERAHADRLMRALENLGGSAPDPPGPEDVAGLASASSAEDILRLAVELEARAVATYVEAHRKLQSPALLETVAQIMANQGQHLVVLRQALGASPAGSVPSAFEGGTEPTPA